jgi:hypothetical protein
MSISFTVRKDEPLEEGSYRAVLKSMEKKTTTFGERILWLFEVPEEQGDAEVAGFTSLSDSTQAYAYLWATAINEKIRSMRSWGPDDVIGRECILDVVVVEGSKGPKNKIVAVRPVPKDI